MVFRFNPSLSFSICLLFVNLSLAQINEHFSDGNFTSNPTWNGSDSLMVINPAFQLQSNGTIAKDLFLSTNSNVGIGEWQVWCRFNLSPSTSNFMRVYLMSDNSNLLGNLNGYYIQCGGVAGNFDSITLYKQKGNSRTRILGGRPSTVSKAINTVRIKVLRDEQGNWQLYADTTGGRNFVLEGIGNDNEFTNVAHLGVFARFTASNSKNFFWDDVYAGSIIVDTLPPKIDSVEILSSKEILLFFDENLEANSALDPNNYWVDNGIGAPSAVRLGTGAQNSILLLFDKELANNVYRLTASGIEDLTGNKAMFIEKTFTSAIQAINPNDVLISEFMADPSPQIGLPNQEFVELYNRSGSPIVLKNWTIGDLSTRAIIPNTEIGKDSFIILCNANSMVDLSGYGKTVGITGMPSLNNSSDMIVIKDGGGKTIHQVNYDITWYNDPLKNNGGYSIEIKNPNQSCKGKQNYAASINPEGGTPGSRSAFWDIQEDTLSPLLISSRALSARSLQLVFNEKMDSNSFINATFLFTPSNIILNRTIGKEWDTVLLGVTNNFTANSPNQLTISNAKDCKGNVLMSNKSVFTYFVPEAESQNDVLISEIMADPDPSIGLPQVEYIELFNRTKKIISIENWTLEDKSSIATIPYFMLMPDSMVTLASSSHVQQFVSNLAVIGLSMFPSLGNENDELVLRNEEGKIIHSIAYDAKWHIDNVKRNGGWSLELKDPENPCSGGSNWTSSVNVQGGTPGKKNSTYTSNKDKKAPELIRAYPLSSNSIQLYFNEPLDSLSAKVLTRYVLNERGEHPQAVSFSGNSFQELILTLNESLLINTQYRVLVDSIEDCAGNVIGNADYSDYGLSQPMDSLDIVINELLFNPKPEGTDYIELLNRSDKILDLKEVFIANTNTDNSIKDYYPIAPEGYILMPKQMIVLSENGLLVQSQYYTPNSSLLWDCQLPSMNDDEGSCVLMDLQNRRYDQINYEDNMHFKLLDNKDGVSLERIDFNRPTSDRSNWTSASSTSGFGTPTYRNSQYANTNASAIIKADPEIFSPDGDGFNDGIQFSYLLDDPGFTGNFYIYNANGVLVKQLLRNEILGTTGVFGWDGIDDNGKVVPIGIYIGYFEFFNLKGEVNKQKLRVVVAAKL